MRGEVLKSVANPTARAIARLTRSGHGAAVSDVYRVYIEDADTGDAFQTFARTT